MTNTTLKLGKLPNDPTKPRLKLSRFLSATAPTYPENIDWLTAVDYWPMYLNDRIGDCTCAAVGHIIQNLSTYGDGATETISDQDVLDAYIKVSGYDPRTGDNDNGAVMQDVLNLWRKEGIGGHKILAFAEVDHRNKDELRAAAHVFGNLYIGFNVPESIWDEFYAGEPWTVHPGSPIEGGHAINSAWYDVSDNMWKVVTWGQVQAMTQEFWDEYVDEAWVVITEEWWNDEGKNPEGLDFNAMGKAFEDITGEDSPFPPSPTPNPPKPIGFWQMLWNIIKEFLHL